MSGRPGWWASSVVAAVTGVVLSALFVAPSPALAGGTGVGVTATTIKVGVPYVDLQAVDRQFGLKIDQGSFPDAYNALFAKVNAAGGINGRKIVPVLVAVNPTGTVAAQTACTQLTEDDPVFVAISPLSPVCYLDHGTPTIDSTVTSPLSVGAAQNFTLSPPSTSYDPVQLAALNSEGLFKNKKVAVFGGETTDENEVGVVDAALRRDHVHVVASAVDSAPASDQLAATQQQAVIAQRFAGEGVNLVVAVGSGSAVWLEGEDSNQATYNPRWVATNEADLAGVVVGKTFGQAYLSDALSTSPVPSQVDIWNDASIQGCVHTIKKAFPSDAIASPIGQPPSDSSNSTYVSVVAACQNVALFVAIAKATGTHLSTATFTRAGYGLKNVAIPGIGSVSFGPGRAYALGPVYMAKYDPSTKQIEINPKPLSSS